MAAPPDFTETIVALSSAAGPGARAVVRLSGPSALSVAGRVFTLPTPSPGDTAAAVPLLSRGCYAGELRLEGVAAPLPADLYVWRAPGSYTGQDLVELHTLSAPPLLELLIAQLLNAGARGARPGEFTLRAFLAGKLDLPRAEAVAGIIEAGSRDELKQALAQLAGGVSRPLNELRNDLLDLLAEVEAGLDFAEEDIRFVEPDELLHRLARGLAQVTLLLKQLDQRGVAGGSYRVVLAGRPNAGKSSLFNALAGAAAALVSPEPGTTRDYLVSPLNLEGLAVELVDTAGLRSEAGAVEVQAQALGREQAGQAHLVLVCVEAGRRPDEREEELLRRAEPPALGVQTKCDLAEPLLDWPTTSAVTGAGLAELRGLLAERARAHVRPALAPSLSRCRHHVTACLGHLRRAHAVVLHEDPPELLALELRGTLDELGEMVGAVYTDDLLDRIFSRFCMGK
jgi:tRNA modification GTPase